MFSNKKHIWPSIKDVLERSTSNFPYFLTTSLQLTSSLNPLGEIRIFLISYYFFPYFGTLNLNGFPTSSRDLVHKTTIIPVSSVFLFHSFLPLSVSEITLNNFFLPRSVSFLRVNSLFRQARVCSCYFLER